MGEASAALGRGKADTVLGEDEGESESEWSR